MKMWGAGRQCHGFCVCVYAHMCTRAGFLEAGSPGHFTTNIFSISFLLDVHNFCFIHSIVYVGFIVCLWKIFDIYCCDVRMEKIPACFIFCSLCMRVNHFWSGNRDVYSPWSVLTPCHMISLWTGWWGSPITSRLASGLECLQTGQCQFGGRMSALEFEDRPESGSLTARMWRGVFTCSDRRSYVCCFLYGVSFSVCVWLLTQCFFIFNLINCLCPQSGTIRKRNVSLWNFRS